ncbi:MAG: hypothetical protein IPJ34_19735 [Myxococcales bacterium]|nr:hypothetical protein [Myxococcales bacterium]
MRSALPRKKSGLDELSLVEATRAGGAHSARRDYRDFAINRRSLRDVLELGDLVSVFGWLDRRAEREYARQLLPRATGAPTRATLYVCPECADPGCGVVRMRVEVREDCVVWSEPAWGDAVGAESPLDQPWRDLWFDRVAYHSALALYL